MCWRDRRRADLEKETLSMNRDLGGWISNPKISRAVLQDLSDRGDDGSLWLPMRWSLGKRREAKAADVRLVMEARSDHSKVVHLLNISQTFAQSF